MSSILSFLERGLIVKRRRRIESRRVLDDDDDDDGVAKSLLSTPLCFEGMHVCVIYDRAVVVFHVKLPVKACDAIDDHCCSVTK